MDHNKLDKNQAFLKEYITEIIDHHFDESDFPNLKKKSLIFPLGSCSSLIILENLTNLNLNLISEKKNLEAENFFKKLFQDFFIFIAAVLVDTKNFLQEELNIRWSNLDFMAYSGVMELNKILFKTKNENFSDEFYIELINSKYNEEANLNLGIKKLLNKDKKEFIYENFKVIWSSLQVGLNKIVDKFSLKNLIEEINENLKNKEFYVLNYREVEYGNTFTYIAIYFKNNQIENKDNKSFLKTFSEKFDLFVRSELEENFISSQIMSDCFYVIKLNQAITRKNFEPILSKFLLKDI